MGESSGPQQQRAGTQAALESREAKQLEFTEQGAGEEGAAQRDRVLEMGRGRP